MLLLSWPCDDESPEDEEDNEVTCPEEPADKPEIVLVKPLDNPPNFAPSE